MATEAIYTKSLGGAEDLLLDASNSSTVIQTRAGKELEITKINSSTIPYSGKFGAPSMVSIKDKLDSTQDQLDASIVLSAYVIDLVEDFGTVPSGIGTVIVKDLNRGGTFIYDATQSAVNNGGTVFDGWVRQYSGAVNVKWFGAVKDTECRSNIQSALDYLESNGGGKLLVNERYLISSVASPDSIGYGIRTHLNGYESENAIIICGTGTLVANNTDMAIIRVSSTGTKIQGLRFESAFGNTYGILASGEDRTATTGTIQSWSFMKINKCFFTGLSEAIYLEPGNTIAASQAGAFYPHITECDFNLCTRNIYCSKAPNDATSRPTRGVISDNRVSRSNTGFDFDYASEFDVDNNSFEFINLGVSPSATPTAYVLRTNAFNIRVNGGYAESCDWVFDNQDTTNTTNAINGFPWTLFSSNNRDFTTGSTNQLIRLGSDMGTYNGSKKIETNHPGFSSINFETVEGRKNITANANNVEIMEWFNGTTTHKGTAGNISFSASGTDISTTATSLSLSSQGFIRVQALRDAVYIGAGGDDYRLSPINIRPTTDNNKSLGEASLKFSTIYAGTGSINTSDAREKTFSDIPEVEVQVAKELKSLVRRFKFNDAINIKGESNARIHYGTSAQEVIAVFTKYNLDAMEYGMVCYDEWEEKLEVKDEEGNINQPYRPAGNRYGIRYEELLCFIISAM